MGGITTRIRQFLGVSWLFLGRLAVLRLFALALLLAGCGGGGGDDGGGIPVTLDLRADVRTPSQVNLSWSSHSTPVTGYQVQRNGAPAFQTIVQGTLVSDFNLEPDTQYCYVVVATVFPIGPVGKSNQACVRTLNTAPWRLETIDAAKTDSNSALVIDAANRFHVSYRRSDGVAYATNTSGQWVGTLIDGTADALGETSIALGTTAVHVSYSDSSTGALKHATNASGSWVISTIDAIGSGSAIAVDSAKRIHVSYKAGAAFGDFLAYAVNVTGSWAREFVAGFGPLAIHTALAIDSTGAAHIAYAVGSGICAVRYATNASGMWVDNTVLSTNSQQCRAALALDASDRAHVAYMQAFDLIYATNASGAWVTMPVDRLDWIGFPDVSIAMDPSGALHVSYQDQNADLKYATNRSGSWVTSWVDARGSVGAGNAVRVDGSGAVHITYLDSSNAKLKHATDR